MEFIIKLWIIWSLAALTTLASAKCPPCKTMTFADCSGTPCQCFLALGFTTNQRLDCTKLIPKCFLTQAEMHRAREGQTIRPREGNLPVGSAEEKHHPECESDGRFKAKQCNGAEQCWCVNSAGVRRTDKRDKNLVCDELVATVEIKLRLTHKPVSAALDSLMVKATFTDAIHQRYRNFSQDLKFKLEYNPSDRSVVLDIKMTNQSADLVGVAYYLEKDLKGLSLFGSEGAWSELRVGGHRLQVEEVQVFHLDERPPDYRPQPAHLSHSIFTLVGVGVGVLVLVGGVMWVRRCRSRD